MADDRPDFIVEFSLTTVENREAALPGIADKNAAAQWAYGVAHASGKMIDDVTVTDRDGVAHTVIGHCESCSAPIWDTDPDDSWDYDSEDPIVLHVRCNPAEDDEPPGNGDDENDWCMTCDAERASCSCHADADEAELDAALAEEHARIRAGEGVEERRAQAEALYGESGGPGGYDVGDYDDAEGLPDE